MYDPPFEVYVGPNAFHFSHEEPNELLALFTEMDRRPSPEAEEVNAVTAVTGLPTMGSTESTLDENQEQLTTDITDLGPHDSSMVLEPQDLYSDDDDDGEPYSTKAYDVSVSVMRERLEIMGFSDVLWREELEEYVARKVADQVEVVEEQEIGTPKRVGAERRLAVLQRSSLERWMGKWLRLVDQNTRHDYTPVQDTLMREMFNDPWIEPIFTRELIALRGALKILEADHFVTCEFTNAVYMENMVGTDEALSETARYTVLRTVREFDPILVLTEGKTDATIIGESFKRIRPEIAHMFSYMDHTTFKVPGSTSALVALARSFAGAKISKRIIFLFDNDTAGHEGLQLFLKGNFPEHYRGLSLPYLSSAEAYPTIGPTGDALVNVNGSACGIELYCGPKALTGDDGMLCSVQWKGYMDGMKRYQGEPLDKNGIKERFLAALKDSTTPRTDPQFEDMRLVLKILSGVRWT